MTAAMAKTSEQRQAIKRLVQLAGQARPRTKALRAACRDVASMVAARVVEAVPEWEWEERAASTTRDGMPRKYAVSEERHREWGTAEWLILDPYTEFDPGDWDDDRSLRNQTINGNRGAGGWLWRDFDHPAPGFPSRNAMIQFARDVADGWLDEVEAWIPDARARAAAHNKQVRAALEAQAAAWNRYMAREAKEDAARYQHWGDEGTDR